MFDPRDPQRYHAGHGIVSAFVPQSQVGCLAGLFLLVVAGALVGLFEGVQLAVAVIALVILVLLIRRALKAEIRREDAGADLPSARGSLPPDAELADEERRDAMRRHHRDDV